MRLSVKYHISYYRLHSIVNEILLQRFFFNNEYKNNEVNYFQDNIERMYKERKSKEG